MCCEGFCENGFVVCVWMLAESDEQTLLFEKGGGETADRADVAVVGGNVRASPNRGQPTSHAFDQMCGDTAACQIGCTPNAKAVRSVWRRVELEAVHGVHGFDDLLHVILYVVHNELDAVFFDQKEGFWIGIET